MMGIETGWYWRLCWRFITPGLMTAVLIYMLLDMSALEYKGVGYPILAHGKATSSCTSILLKGLYCIRVLFSPH